MKFEWDQVSSMYRMYDGKVEKRPREYWFQATLGLPTAWSGVLCGFACLVCEQVIDAYTRMLKAKKGEIDAIVTTAEPLTAPQEKALAAGLKAQVWFTSCRRVFPLRPTVLIRFTTWANLGEMVGDPH